MLQEYLEVNPTYIIYSTISNGVFLDSNRQAYHFFVRADADTFCREHPDTRVGRPEFYTRAHLCSVCYQQGALSVIIAGNTHREMIHISPRDCEPAFYNPDLNADVALLQQTKDKQYLSNMRNRNFIVPAKIKESGKTEIVYGTVHLNKQQEYLFLAFTSIEEYDLWSTDIPGWSPLLVSFESLCQICGKRAVLVNPLGNRFALPPAIIKEIQNGSSGRK